jgi:hypothetical protein
MIASLLRMKLTRTIISSVIDMNKKGIRVSRQTLHTVKVSQTSDYRSNDISIRKVPPLLKARMRPIFTVKHERVKGTASLKRKRNASQNEARKDLSFFIPRKAQIMRTIQTKIFVDLAKIPNVLSFIYFCNLKDDQLHLTYNQSRVCSPH